MAKPAHPARATSGKSPRHPGHVVMQDYLEPLGMSQRALARAMGIRVSHLNYVLRGRRAVGAEMALRLGKVLRTTPDYWLDLQKAWDFWKVRRSRDGAAIARLKPIVSSRGDRRGRGLKR